MAYDANGNWISENDSVESRVRGLSGQDNELNKQTRTQAAQAANARGLQNSSIAAGAGEDAVLKSAVSIATPDAATAAQKNLSAQGAQQTTTQQAQQIQGQKELQAVDVASREKLAQADTDAAAARLNTQLTSAEKVAAADVTSREGMALAERQMQERIANLNVSASNRQEAGRAATAIQQTYASSFAAIAANPDLPAAVRAQYIEHISSVMRGNVAMVESLWNVQLPVWETTPMPSTPPGGGGGGDSGGGGGSPAPGTPAAPRASQPSDTEDGGAQDPYDAPPTTTSPELEEDQIPNPPVENRWWDSDNDNEDA